MHMWEPIVKKQYLVLEQQWLWLTEIWETCQSGWHRASELVWEQFQIFQVAQESQLSWDCPSQIISPEVQPLCNEENVYTYMRTTSEETISCSDCDLLRFERLAKLVGTEPMSWFEVRSSRPKLLKSPSSVGIVPFRSLLEKDSQSVMRRMCTCENQ